jgi:hypothetical protein
MAESAARAAPGKREGARLLIVCLVLVLGGAGLIRFESWYLQARREDRLAERADERVSARIEASQRHRARGEWDEVERQLQMALLVEGARNKDEVHHLLRRLREDRAATILDAAGQALAGRDVPRAQQLLRAYLEHPDAADQQGARRLQADLARALSEEEAGKQLARLSDEELARCEAGGPLPAEGTFSPEVRPLWRETLLRGVARERGRGRRAEGHRRFWARLWATPAGRRLRAFVDEVLADVGEDAGATPTEEVAFRLLWDQLGVTEGARRRLRRTLRQRHLPEELERRVARQRAAIKREFREFPEAASADAAAFDRLVDDQLDRLLAAVRAEKGDAAR